MVTKSKHKIEANIIDQIAVTDTTASSAPLNRVCVNETEVQLKYGCSNPFKMLPFASFTEN